ncbi:MAG TPA: zinc dependent phospholipase C family protein [Puia sp.]|nr:zinc dependent phospholipase C family protein [Puia sp.]
MKKICCILALLTISFRSYCWGFYMHEKINYHAVFLLPPQMMILFKPNIGFLTEHAVDPDKRRYISATEGAHHFLDIDHYGQYPYPDLPRDYKSAQLKYSEDSLRAYGIVPWWIQIMMGRLTKAFREKDKRAILKMAAELGHYVADAHVPLHVCSNHNGQLTHQEGIHAFWESRIPELFAEADWDFFIGKAVYITDLSGFIWKRILESAAAADTVLRCEKEISAMIRPDQKYAFEERKGKLVKQYSTEFASMYEERLDHMIERRMRQSIFAVASCWYTAWVNAGQPQLEVLIDDSLTVNEKMEYERLNLEWKNNTIKGWDCQ